jgi:hypothetical protein
MAVDAVCRKFRDLLQGGGRVYITVPSANSLHFGGAPTMSTRAGLYGVRRLLTPEEWHTLLITGTGLKVVERYEIMLKPYENARMECLSPHQLDYLARYRGAGGALAYFELEAV